MKLKKKEKRRITMLALILGVLVVGMIGTSVLSIGNRIQSEKHCFEDSLKGDIICVESPLSEALSIASLSEGEIVAPGTKVRVSASLNYDPNELPLEGVIIDLYKDGKLINSWTKTDYVNSYLNPSGETFTGERDATENKYFYSVSNIALVEEGQYKYEWKVFNKINDLIDSDTINILVKEQVEEETCSLSSSTSDWEVLQNIANGKQYEKILKTVQSDCTYRTTKDYKTVCNDGYIAKGTTSKYSNTLTSCLLAPEEEPKDDSSDSSENSETQTTPEEETDDEDDEPDGSESQTDSSTTSGTSQTQTGQDEEDEQSEFEKLFDFKNNPTIAYPMSLMILISLVILGFIIKELGGKK